MTLVQCSVVQNRYESLTAVKFVTCCYDKLFLQIVDYDSCQIFVYICHLQYTEEKLGQAEKTEYDAQFESLLLRAERTQYWTEKFINQTETVLIPDPGKIEKCLVIFPKRYIKKTVD